MNGDDPLVSLDFSSPLLDDFGKGGYIDRMWGAVLQAVLETAYDEGVNQPTRLYGVLDPPAAEVFIAERAASGVEPARVVAELTELKQELLSGDEGTRVSPFVIVKFGELESGDVVAAGPEVPVPALTGAIVVVHEVSLAVNPDTGVHVEHPATAADTASGGVGDALVACLVTTSGHAMFGSLMLPPDAQPVSVLDGFANVDLQGMLVRERLTLLRVMGGHIPAPVKTPLDVLVSLVLSGFGEVVREFPKVLPPAVQTEVRYADLARASVPVVMAMVTWRLSREGTRWLSADEQGLIWTLVEQRMSVSDFADTEWTVFESALRRVRDKVSWADFVTEPMLARLVQRAGDESLMLGGFGDLDVEWAGEALTAALVDVSVAAPEDYYAALTAQHVDLAPVLVDMLAPWWTRHATDAQ